MCPAITYLQRINLFFLQDNHNETLGKLSFVLDLVECILDLARSLGSAFRNVDPVETKKVGIVMIES